MKIQVGPIVYDVVYEKKSLEKHFLDTKEEVAGLWLPCKGKIVVSPDYPFDWQQEILNHEVIHAVVDLIGFQFKDDEEEQFVRTFSPAYLDTLRRNPKFTKHILEKRC